MRWIDGDGAWFFPLVQSALKLYISQNINFKFFKWFKEKQSSPISNTSVVITFCNGNETLGTTFYPIPNWFRNQNKQTSDSQLYVKCLKYPGNSGVTASRWQVPGSPPDLSNVHSFFHAFGVEKMSTKCAWKTPCLPRDFLGRRTLLVLSKEFSISY